MKIKTFGSVCSGIEAASYVLKPLGVKPLWLSEIEEFPCNFLAANYSEAPNLGDMNDIPTMISEGAIDVPDLLCGGTPCQAFSLAGWREGINDDRGQLTLKFFDILNRMDDVRLAKGLNRAICFWENVEGVLTDEDNAFGCFLAGLAGLENPIISPLEKRYKKIKEGDRTIKKEIKPKWSEAGILYGKERNIAWRVLDAKYFGLPQQRKRIYVIAGGKDFHPENVLFENGDKFVDPFKIINKQDEKMLSLFSNDNESDSMVDQSLTRNINGHDIEIFRTYTDCLYAAYGTKWNGNAAALNGSLFISQNGRLRRLSPVECERIMGFPDNYTLLPNCKDTQRFKATGNSWAVNVVRWIISRLCNYDSLSDIKIPSGASSSNIDYTLYSFRDFVYVGNGFYLNATDMPYHIKTANMLDFVDTEVDKKLYISPAGCAGILRRKKKHNSGMNARLEIVLEQCLK